MLSGHTMLFKKAYLTAIWRQLCSVYNLAISAKLGFMCFIGPMSVFFFTEDNPLEQN